VEHLAVDEEIHSFSAALNFDVLHWVDRTVAAQTHIEHVLHKLPITRSRLTDSVNVLHPTPHKIGHFRDALPSQSLD